jgi:uncharacterized protein YjiS (DUF1127 family)
MPQIIFYTSHQINKFYFGWGGAHVAVMLMRPEKPASPLKSALRRMADNFLATINSSNFAAAQRRRALRGLDSHQLADIGLIYVDGDYRPHPDALTLVVPAKAGTHTPRSIDRSRGIGPGSRPARPGRQKL